MEARPVAPLEPNALLFPTAGGPVSCKSPNSGRSAAVRTALPVRFGDRRSNRRGGRLDLPEPCELPFTRRPVNPADQAPGTVGRPLDMHVHRRELQRQVRTIELFQDQGVFVDQVGEFGARAVRREVKTLAAVGKRRLVAETGARQPRCGRLVARYWYSTGC